MSTVTTSATNTTLTDSSSGSTTTETSVAANDLTAADLVERVASLEATLFTSLVEDNLTSVTEQIGGLTVLAATLNATAAATEGFARIAMGDTEVAVTVPASLFASFGAEGLVLTLATYDLTMANLSGEVQVVAVVEASLLSLTTGRRIEIADLRDPIKVDIPVGNNSAGLQCAYWDEGTSTWAITGVELVSVNEGVVECKTTHLTLFGAIVRGFVETFACSQVQLLSAESVKQLGKGDWQRTSGALALESLVAMFLLLLLVAVWLDRRRSKQGMTSDARLLIPLRGEDGGQQQGERQDNRREDGLEEHPEEHLAERPEERAEDGGGDRGRCARAAGCVVAGTACLVNWCRTSGALWDALNEIFSQWFTYFGEVRDLVEAVGTVVQEQLCCHDRPTFEVLIDGLLRRTLVVSARRQAASALGVSGDFFSLVLEDKNLTDVVLAYRVALRDSLLVPSAREEEWGRLHCDLEAKLDVVIEAATHWSALPGTVWRLFLFQNPVYDCLVHSLTSCKMRVMLFTVDLVGSLMLTTLFYSAGGVTRKRGRGFNCEFSSTAGFAGRVVAIGTASALFAGIPATILGSLCTRSVKKFAYVGCPAWNKQLKAWRTQDKLSWIFGSLYIGFAVFFNSLFLANVDQEELAGWLTSVLISFVQDLFIIPLAPALFLVFLTTASLQFTTWRRRATKKAIVSKLHEDFKRGANMETVEAV